MNTLVFNSKDIEIGDEMSKFWKDYPDIERELEYVKETMLKVSKSSEQYLNNSFDYLYSTGGKMLRPAFLIIGSLFGTKNVENAENIRQLAAAIEMLHSATLVHDDIIDESYLRRGKESIHSKYSKEYAVYMGDYLFSQWFLMLSEFDISHTLLKELAKGISMICKGEMIQNQYRYNLDISVRKYLKIISGKTAALFAASLSAGANETDLDSKQIKKIAKAGHHIGMAFQLTDDLLDYKSDEKTLGKEVQSDILRGYYTLPIILSLNSEYSSDIKKILLKDILKKEDISLLIELTQKSGAIDKTEEMAERYTKKAIEDIQGLPDSKGKNILLEIIPKLLKRNY